jgi:serine O-acetyltransferase
VQCISRLVGMIVLLAMCDLLGGTGKERGDRHPKIGDNVLLSTGCTVLGTIKMKKYQYF